MDPRHPRPHGRLQAPGSDGDALPRPGRDAALLRGRDRVRLDGGLGIGKGAAQPQEESTRARLPMRVRPDFKVVPVADLGGSQMEKQTQSEQFRRLNNRLKNMKPGGKKPTSKMSIEGRGFDLPRSPSLEDGSAHVTVIAVETEYYSDVLTRYTRNSAHLTLGWGDPESDRSPRRAQRVYFVLVRRRRLVIQVENGPVGIAPPPHPSAGGHRRPPVHPPLRPLLVPADSCLCRRGFGHPRPERVPRPVRPPPYPSAGGHWRPPDYPPLRPLNVPADPLQTGPSPLSQ
ncbi:hypothetical protein BDK51DRAFT_38243 [Blyttiomyces helicus]|uniref:Uncharacterized protein n=1 Tax=Blyttiomyces helicus TaxID=388810 RepID=A0A4V1IPX9_9FUNG|nr:hypothetical protein BDK51DRAFT_38243 [Blyttiomyces helicus]|eukprot:RKO84617.1 hypothetical protein BDK51DRAFT_38243 [Blyttiomyces helicus]